MIFENGKEIPLWNGEPVMSHGSQAGIDIPTITPYFPAVWNSNRKAIVIYPGGAYSHLAEHEGRGYAEYFAGRGFHCFVVKYRLGADKKYFHPAELADAARGVRLVRAAAKELGIRPDCIGVMGSSAGGHLAATVSNMHEQASKSPDEGDVAKVSSRPDFAVLCYPVISADQAIANKGSFVNLLGLTEFDEAKCRALSQELLVTKQTPPTFLWHTMQDNGVLCENSLVYAEALRKAGVAFELHIYEKGPHGQGLFKGHPWAEECVRWLNGF